MQKKWTWAIGIIVALVVIAIVIFIFLPISYLVGPIPNIGPGMANPSCDWVYKTAADYSGLWYGKVMMRDGKEELIHISHKDFGEEKLVEGYWNSYYICTEDNVQGFVFFSKEYKEKQLQEAALCKEEKERRKEQLRMEKCGGFFDVYVECQTFSSHDGSRNCMIQVPPKDKPDYTECEYDLTLEESLYIRSCTDIIEIPEEKQAREAEKLQEEMLNAIIARDPFEELYFCGEKGEKPLSIEELNEIITLNKLSIECEKIK